MEVFGDMVSCGSHYCGKTPSRNSLRERHLALGTVHHGKGAVAAGTPLANTEGACSGKSYTWVGQETD